MGRKLQLLTLIVGLMLYLFDLGSDIYVAFQLWKNNESWWFWMTTIFIAVPSLIVNVTSIFQLTNVWSFIVGVLQLSMVVRYAEMIGRSYSKTWDSGRAYSFAKIRYLETITESAPQWCLQAYIMLRQWNFPSYTVVSIVFSFLSLAWSITTLEITRIEDDQKQGNMKLIEKVSYLIWQLSTLISRLSAIVFFAYVFRYYVFMFLAAHWVLLAVILIKQGEKIIQEASNPRETKLPSWLACYPSLFHPPASFCPEEAWVDNMIFGYISIIIENIIMVTLCLTIEVSGVTHMDVLKPAAISCLVGGTFLPIIFFIVEWLALRTNA